MGWKDLSYWVRGGISLGFIGILLMFLRQMSIFYHIYIISDIVGILSFPLAYLEYYLDISSRIMLIIIIAPLYFIYYFIIGALISGIYMNLKNRNASEEKSDKKKR